MHVENSIGCVCMQYAMEASDCLANVALPAEDGADVQEALSDISHRRTVPQVFIGGKFVGGADGTDCTLCARAHDVCAWLATQGPC